MSRRFKGLRADPRPYYDAIIIGAGVGGLICANLLVRSGLSVLLVEQHYMVGGYCSTFKRKGFVFDAATHFYPLLGNPATITGRLLVDLGVKTAWIKMDPVDQFHFPDHTTFGVSADFDCYVAAIKQEFPNEASAIDSFFGLVRRVYMLGLLQFFRGHPTEQLRPYLGLSVQDVLDAHFRASKLKLLLTADTGHWGSPPKRTSFVFDSMLRLAYFLGNYYPKGSSQALADELAACFEDRGGDILMSSLVRQIRIRSGMASGVEIETGRGVRRTQLVVNAGVVVSNADVQQTIQRLVPSGFVEPDYVTSLKQLRLTSPCFIMHVGLQGISTELLEKVQGYHWSSWDPNDVATAAFKIFVPTLFDPELAPSGGHILIVQKITDIDYCAVQDWAAHKATVEEGITAVLKQIIPRFEAHVVVKLSASALTSHRFTLNNCGAMLGWELAPDQVDGNRPAVTSPISNLYFVGHWTRPGGGVTPVMVSAMKVARLITGNHDLRITPSPILVAPAVSTTAASA